MVESGRQEKRTTRTIHDLYNANSAGSIRILRNASLSTIRSPPDQSESLMSPALWSRLTRGTTKDGLNLMSPGDVEIPSVLRPELGTTHHISIFRVLEHSLTFRYAPASSDALRYNHRDPPHPEPGNTSSEWSDRCPDFAKVLERPHLVSIRFPFASKNLPLETGNIATSIPPNGERRARPDLFGKCSVTVLRPELVRGCPYKDRNYGETSYNDDRPRPSHALVTKHAIFSLSRPPPSIQYFPINTYVELFPSSYSHFVHRTDKRSLRVPKKNNIPSPQLYFSSPGSRGLNPSSTPSPPSSYTFHIFSRLTVGFSVCSEATSGALVVREVPSPFRIVSGTTSDRLGTFSSSLHFSTTVDKPPQGLFQADQPSNSPRERPHSLHRSGHGEITKTSSSR
jgi:hypothetical protein